MWKYLTLFLRFLKHHQGEAKIEKPTYNSGFILVVNSADYCPNTWNNPPEFLLTIKCSLHVELLMNIFYISLTGRIHVMLNGWYIIIPLFFWNLIFSTIFSYLMLLLSRIMQRCANNAKNHSKIKCLMFTATFFRYWRQNKQDAFHLCSIKLIYS